MSTPELLDGAWPEVVVDEAVAFAERDGERLTCDIYRPAGPARPRAAVVLEPGAPDARNPRRMRGYAMRHARRGYVAVCAQWRLDLRDPGRPGWPHPVEDVQAAILWARTEGARYDIDPARVAIQSYSAGGTISLVAAGRLAGDVAAAVAVCTNVDHTRRVIEPPFRALLHGNLTPGRLSEASPIAYAASLPATLLINGGADPGVPVEQGQWMVEALQSAGTPVEWHVFAGQGHVFDKAPEFEAVCADLIGLFLDRYVR